MENKTVPPTVKSLVVIRYKLFFPKGPKTIRYGQKPATLLLCYFAALLYFVLYAQKYDTFSFGRALVQTDVTLYIPRVIMSAFI